MRLVLETWRYILFPQVALLPEFAAFIREDASSVCQREETDSIPIIDDIRFHITNFMQTYSDMYEADDKMSVIDRLLEDLALDA